MIFYRETREGDKKSIYLFCIRNEEELIQLKNNSSNESNDDVVLNENDVPSSGNTKNGSEECTNIQKTKDTNELNVENLQPDCSLDSKHENETNKQYGVDSVLKNDLESKVTENDKQLEVVHDDVSATNNDENTAAHTWDDYDCFKISQEKFFPVNVMDLDVQKTIITRFLNFYVGGKIPKGLRASDLLFAVISIFPLTNETDELIWHEIEYRDDGCLFFITPEERLNNEFKAIVKKANKTRNNTIKDGNVIDSNSNKFNNNDSKKNSGTPPCGNEKTPKCEEQNNKGSSDIDSETISSDVSYDDVLSSFITDLTENISIKWHGSTRSAASAHIPSSKKYGPVENSAFISSCNKLLIEWHESNRSRIIMKWFFGIVALTLMRGIVKGKKNINNTLISKNFLDKIKFIEPDINYTPPRESCVEKCCKELMLRERHHKVMFAKIIFNSIRIDILKSGHLISNNYGFYNVFRMCVVDQTAYYDMGILNMLKSIYGSVGPGTEFSIILSHLKAGEINDSMEQVRNFILKYMRNEKCRTYHWARYFDSTQFEYLSCSKSYATAVMLAVLIEKMMRKPDVWRSGWVRTQQENLDEYKQLAEQLYKQYECLCIKKCTLQQQFFSCPNQIDVNDVIL